MLSAFRLQRLRHSPHVKHFSSSIISRSSCVIAPYGQLTSHCPHNEHRSSFTLGAPADFGAPLSAIRRIVNPLISSTDE
jgi:hypothetical protein